MLDELPSLTAEDFYRPNHEALFALMQAMSASGEPVETLNVLQRLTSRPVPNVDAAYLHTLYASCATWHNAGWYAKTIRQLSRLRRMAAAGVAGASFEMRDIENQIDSADVFQGVVLEVDELLRAEVERRLPAGGASGADHVGAELTCEIGRAHV